MCNKEVVRAAAINLGFSSCGFTTPASPDHFSTFDRWLKMGYQAGMSFLDSQRSRECRKDPTRLLDSCLSIIVLTFPYRFKQPATSPDIGGIASYALLNDYHLFLPALMGEFHRRIEALFDRPIRSLACCDSSPVLERDLAWRAGLGGIGKNGCLISPQQGSFIFIAELLVDIPIEPDLPFSKKLCGNCIKCIVACPTGCLQEGTPFDSNLCIAYHTIENRGAIPNPIRSQIGSQIFGCDICQSVCPWNHPNRARGTFSAPEFSSLPDPVLQQEISLDKNAFKEKYKDTAVLRSKYKGYMRNICVALGNARNENAVSILSQKLLNEEEPLIRAHAAWALGRINSPICIDFLQKALLSEKDPAVLEEIQRALLLVT